MRALRGEASGGVFRFAERIGHFVLAADVRKALDLPDAGGRQKNRSAGSELGLHVSHAGDHVAMKTRAGPRREFKLCGGTVSKRELLDMNLRSFSERSRNFLFGPEEVRDGGGVGVTVTFVIFRGSRKIVRRGFTQSFRLLEEDDRPQRTFRQLKERARPRFACRPEE